MHTERRLMKIGHSLNCEFPSFHNSCFVRRILECNSAAVSKEAVDFLIAREQWVQVKEPLQTTDCAEMTICHEHTKSIFVKNYEM